MSRKNKEVLARPVFEPAPVESYARVFAEMKRGDRKNILGAFGDATLRTYSFFDAQLPKAQQGQAVEFGISHDESGFIIDSVPLPGVVVCRIEPQAKRGPASQRVMGPKNPDTGLRTFKDIDLTSLPALSDEADFVVNFSEGDTSTAGVKVSPRQGDFSFTSLAESMALTAGAMKFRGMLPETGYMMMLAMSRLPSEEMDQQVVAQ